MCSMLKALKMLNSCKMLHWMADGVIKCLHIFILY